MQRDGARQLVFLLDYCGPRIGKAVGSGMRSFKLSVSAIARNALNLAEFRLYALSSNILVSIKIVVGILIYSDS